MSDSEELWSAAWMLTHVVGLVVMVILSRRSARQVQVSEHWLARAESRDKPDALDLVTMTSDRHRLYMAMTFTAGLYLVVGLLVFSQTVEPWLSMPSYRLINRTLLTIGEVTWIAAAWLSLATGEHLSRESQAVADVEAENRSYRQIADEAVTRLEAQAAGHVAERGQPLVAILAPVVPEHQSPPTLRQQATADLQTMRARLVAATLALGQPPRAAGPPSDVPEDVER
jgi:hypothetical protein